MDIIQLIKHDHRTVKGLFQKFERARSSRDRRRIAEQVIEELSRHSTAEEQLLYPLIRDRDPKREEAVLEALEEHHLAKMTLAELDKMSVEDERYEAKMKVLSEAVRHHIEEEESELLPRLERITSADERRGLAQAVEKAKEAAPNHPHPMAPDTPPGNVVVGLLAKVLDTGKDVARMVISPAKAQARSRAKKAMGSKKGAAHRAARRARRTTAARKRAAG